MSEPIRRTVVKFYRAMGTGTQSSATQGSVTGRPKTVAQVRAIYGVAKSKGIDSDTLHELVCGLTRKSSIAALTYTEAERVIQRLKGRSFVPLRTLQYRRQKAGVKQLVQQTQLDLIAQLAAQRQWTNYSLTAFCLKVCKRSRPLTTDEANKVIEGLKVMNRRDGLWAA